MGTYTGDTRVPVVEGGELVHQVDHGGDLVLGVVAQDLLSGELGGDVVAVDLTLEEALDVGLEGAVGNGGVVRVPGAVQLEVVTGDGVVRIVGDRVKVLVLTAHLLALGVRDGDGVAEGAVVDNVVETLLMNTAEDVVETTVLHENPDNVLNLVLQVGNGLLGARGVAEGGLAVAGDDSANGAAGQTQEGKESVGLHFATAVSDLEGSREGWLMNERENHFPRRDGPAFYVFALTCTSCSSCSMRRGSIPRPTWEKDPCKAGQCELISWDEQMSDDRRLHMLTARDAIGSPGT